MRRFCFMFINFFTPLSPFLNLEVLIPKEPTTTWKLILLQPGRIA